MPGPVKTMLILAAGLPAMAAANSWMGMAQMSNDMFRQQMLDPAGITRSQGVLQRAFDDRMIERAGKAGGQAKTDEAGLGYPAGQASRVPARLAASLPSTLPPKQAAAAYEQLLTIYRDGMQHAGLPANDVGVALGVFIVGNYQVASGKAVPEAQSSAIYRQMRQLVASDATLRQLDSRTRQDWGEQLAIVGTLMEVIYQQAQSSGDKTLLASSQAAARDYLQQVLQRPYSQLRFGPQGLTLAK